MFPAALAVAGLWVSLFHFREPERAIAAMADAGSRQPVLVELFTSEGCSSCPPADALLARLDATQFVQGAQAIVLSEHVTYWNQLGWRDRFSSDEMTERQQHYAAHFGLDSVYTPQVVVDGSVEMVGSDAAALSRAIARAGEKPKTELGIESVAWREDGVHFSVHAGPAAHGELLAALAEDAEQSTVSRGENAGRTLRHVAVVRELNAMGTHAADGRPLVLKASSKGEAAEGAKTMRLVVFLADPFSGKVSGVAEATVTK